MFFGKPSNASPILTVYLNESPLRSVQEFVAKRNPEFALNVIGYWNDNYYSIEGKQRRALEDV